MWFVNVIYRAMFVIQQHGGSEGGCSARPLPKYQMSSPIGFACSGMLRNRFAVWYCCAKCLLVFKYTTGEFVYVRVDVCL